MTIEAEPAPQSGSPSPIGRLLAGRYRLQSVLGEGGMAIVYEGEHVAIGKRVAIKLVQSLFANDDEIVSRFEREARSAGSVESEHIVHVFDVGADPDLGLFLVMELLKGHDLARVLMHHGRLDPVFACGIVLQAALGLEKAHAKGIIHRDLKPANVFLVERDDGTTQVKLVDFGIAKVVREAHETRFSRKGITRRGTAIGTPQYMSPEQAQGLESVDHRTDVYSLGAVLFEAIAGHPTMQERATYEQTILHLISTPAPRLRDSVPDVPEELDQLVADMLEHDLDRRVHDMRAVRERIGAIYPALQGTSVKLRSLPAPAQGAAVHASSGPQPPTVPGTAAAVPLVRAKPRRRPVALVAGLAAVLGVTLGVLAMRTPARVPAAAPPTVVTLTVPVPMPPAPTASVEPAAVATTTASAPSATASVATTAGASASAKPGPKRGPGGGGGAAPRPTDQVGAAGISSQF